MRESRNRAGIGASQIVTVEKAVITEFISPKKKSNSIALNNQQQRRTGLLLGDYFLVLTLHGPPPSCLSILPCVSCFSILCPKVVSGIFQVWKQPTQLY